ncbi:hypothetical protein GCM10010094_40780 [Streptomyces flaveus]|uniref:Uncharacterized protein n=1 Tax=Streptomyces flaveus TaxID=66370 RepID=A0A917QYJ2_9ACTN|nr:hypothetical protein GCM10010094_40780 [Streptomyces flaveus]
MKAWAPSVPRLNRLPWDLLLHTNMGAHPIAAQYAMSSDRSPLAIEDVAGPGFWRRTSTYQTMHTLFDVDDQLALPLRAPADAIRSFLICRLPGRKSPSTTARMQGRSNLCSYGSTDT